MGFKASIETFGVSTKCVIIAVAHGSVAIRMVTQVIQSTSYWLAYVFCIITATVFIIAYLLTNTFCIRMIEES